jgi:hypothetical protein
LGISGAHRIPEVDKERRWAREEKEFCILLQVHVRKAVADAFAALRLEMLGSLLPEATLEVKVRRGSFP